MTDNFGSYAGKLEERVKDLECRLDKLSVDLAQAMDFLGQYTEASELLERRVAELESNQRKGATGGEMILWPPYVPSR